MDIPFYREFTLPWSSHAGQERKFRRLLGIIMAVTLFLGIVWPWIPTPEKDPNVIEEIPPRIAKLLLEQKPPPPPPKPVEPEPEPEPDPIAEPEPEQVAKNLRRQSPSRNQSPFPSPKLTCRLLPANRRRLRYCHSPKTWQNLLTAMFLRP